MNRTIALAAIVMVAVIMGMSAFVPAAMAKGNPNGVSPEYVEICHRGGVATSTPSDDLWEVMTIKEQAVPAHEKHGDFEIDIPDKFEGKDLADCTGFWNLS